MAFLGPTELRKFLSENLIITDDDDQNCYSEGCIEQAAYALSLGSEAYRTDNKDRKVEILDDKNRNVEINPGQFTLLMTNEYVNIPKDKLAFISIKAKQKLKGLVNVSGFHVDPGFKGKLLFSVYNASPSTITLETKKPYFLIWFANLESEAKVDDLYNSTKNHHQAQKSIKLEYIDALKRGELASPSALLEKIKDNEVLFNRFLWIGGLVLTLSITLCIKFYSDANSYKNGYEEGKKERIIEKEIKHKVDSIVKKSIYLYNQDKAVTKNPEIKNVTSK